MKLFEPYRGTEGAWDWQMIAFAATTLSNLFLGRDLGVFIVAIILVIFVAIAVAHVWFAQHALAYFWHILKDRTLRSTKTAPIMRGIIIGWVLIMILSFTLYHYDYIAYALHINLLGLAFLLLVLGASRVDAYEQRLITTKPSPQLPNDSMVDDEEPSIVDYL